jgi:hypothetical protein
VQDLDKETRIRLWNLCSERFLSNRAMVNHHDEFYSGIWQNLFKEPWDTIEAKDSELRYRRIRNYFLQNAPWHEVYDLIENIAEQLDRRAPWEKEETLLLIVFRVRCNEVLAEENCPYRLSGTLVIPITSEEQILEIEKAKEIPLKNVRHHIDTALKYLSSKAAPDYRNAIKESIQALEGYCQRALKKDGETLGACLNSLRKSVNLRPHGGFITIMEKLWVYSNSPETGARHATSEGGSSVLQEDARFCVVVCSAFLNLLEAKQSCAELKDQAHRP